jgi:2-isopropylmalate synthase
MKQIILNDVVLRDGAQVEGGKMSPKDQLTHVENIIRGGVDVIEIGYPGSSLEQMEQCKRIVSFVDKLIKSEPKLERPILSALAMATKKQIDAVKESGCDRVHIYIPSSDKLLLAQFGKGKYGNTPEEKRQWAIRQAVKMVKYAKEISIKQSQYSPEDAARAGKEYIRKISQAVVDAGIDVLNIPETTGLCIGNEFGDLIGYLMENVAGIKNVVVSVHCHNDSDCATANAIAGILNGALQVEGTFFGLGERSGMTKLESIVMVVNTRRDRFSNRYVNFDKRLCVKVVNFIAGAIGMSVPRHWPVVGHQNSICSSGGHQAIEAQCKASGEESAYYGWNPELYGHKKVNTVITESSGRSGVADRLKELSIRVSEKQLSEICDKVKKVSEAKGGRGIDEKELTAVAQEVVANIPYRMEVTDSQVVGGTMPIPNSVIVLRYEEVRATESSVGDGTMDAAMKAVHRTAKRIFPILCEADITLDYWRSASVTKGTEAMADSYCRIRVKYNEVENVFVGTSSHLDTTQATAQAYANCLSWFLASLD